VLEDAPILDITPSLSPPSEGQDLVADYASVGLTLGRHPMALLRPRLDRLRMVTATQLKQLPHGKLTRAAGIVIGRQRPDTASGVIFVTLEDETGMINVVVWRDVAAAACVAGVPVARCARRRQGGVIHLIGSRRLPPQPARGPRSGIFTSLFLRFGVRGPRGSASPGSSMDFDSTNQSIAGTAAAVDKYPARHHPMWVADMDSARARHRSAQATRRAQRVQQTHPRPGDASCGVERPPLEDPA
jgi:hypothetical protein